MGGLAYYGRLLLRLSEKGVKVLASQAYPVGPTARVSGTYAEPAGSRLQVRAAAARERYAERRAIVTNMQPTGTTSPAQHSRDAAFNMRHHLRVASTALWPVASTCVWITVAALIAITAPYVLREHIRVAEAIIFLAAALGGIGALVGFWSLGGRY